MNKQMLAVMQRRGELLERIATQRGQVAAMGRRLQTPLSLADQGMGTVRYLRSKPVLVAGAVALLMIRRRGVTGLVINGWRLWRLYKSARSFYAKSVSSQTAKI